MWGQRTQSRRSRAGPRTRRPAALKEAVRKARIEIAERSGVVVDLRDAELARLELLNEALDPLFDEIPPEIELFDRGISRGDMPRLWIDAIAHVVMGRDKRRYTLRAGHPLSAARCWRNRPRSPTSSRRSRTMSRAAWSSASGRWPRTPVRSATAAARRAHRRRRQRRADHRRFRVRPGGRVAPAVRGALESWRRASSR